jgi:hypothetical protein
LREKKLLAPRSISAFFDGGRLGGPEASTETPPREEEEEERKKRGKKEEKPDQQVLESRPVVEC